MIKKIFNPLILVAAAMLSFHACTQEKAYMIQRSDMEPHIIKLSSDEFMGRLPFTEGEQLTVNYLAAQFEALGLEPGNVDSYFQEVPLVSVTTFPSEKMDIQLGNKKMSIQGLEDFVIWTQRTEEEIAIKDAEIIFAGYGIVAPEYNWNDYQDLDVKGKIVMVLVNDPGFGIEDGGLFKGNTMTYYGRWTYKFEEAARQGALGCLIVHDTAPAGYGFNVIQNNWNSPKLYLDDRGKEKYKNGFEGWVTLPVAKQIFDFVGLNAEVHFNQAKDPSFKAINLGALASVSMTTQSKYDVSRNVIAKITGKQAPDEVVIYTAHWDHLGVGKPDENNDSIYNGALDNASGMAALLAFAKGFKAEKQPRRTVAFLMVTAEEQGLWGSAYYAENPIFPKEKTVANINIDGVNPYGKMKDVSLIGVGQSDLEDVLNEELAKVGRYSSPEPNPAVGYYYRSDHFNFAKIGIPALYIGTGIDHLENGKDYGKSIQDDYTMKHYHKVSDEYNASAWNWEGTLDDAQLLFEAGKRIVNAETWPQWKNNSEFKSIRDAYIK
jgi:Zn-dependent M28 family amino/carboxypeptidase